jgi:nucleoid DNA-binding protein
MRTKRGGAIAAGLVLFLGVAGVVYSQRPAPRIVNAPPPPGAGAALVKRVAVRAKLPEKTVQAVLEALGPEVAAGIQRGGTETLPKLGRFRIVRVEAHKDMERGTGRLLSIPAKNFIIFDPEAEVEAAGNVSTVVPNEVVPAFEYNVMPGQTPSQKAGSLKTRSLRTP